jgi:hypothetical protein
MTPEEERFLDRELNKILAGHTKEVRDLYEARRSEILETVDKMRVPGADIKEILKLVVTHE